MAKIIGVKFSEPKSRGQMFMHCRIFLKIEGEADFLPTPDWVPFHGQEHYTELLLGQDAHITDHHNLGKSIGGFELSVYDPD